MKQITIYIIILFISLVNQLHGQSNRIQKKIKTQSNAYSISSKSIAPNGFSAYFLNGDEIPNSLYKVDCILANFYASDSLVHKADSIWISYYPFALDFNHTYYLKELKPNNDSIGQSNLEQYYTFNKQQHQQKSILAEFEKQGNISRGISVGNAQNLAVSSSMNLELQGMLTPEIKLSAVITDNNIPIQADGTTQQLQDFDEVYIQLDHKNGSLRAGDFRLKKPDAHFLNYNKKAQGASIQTQFGDAKKQIRAYASLAIAKGKYHRFKFSGVEGNQGPYKLQGKNFERYIVVISGSEKVYMDGKLLVRGESNDYIINYNTAEITFMPRIIVTKDKRFEVEFEYSEQHYSRSITAGGLSWQGKKLEISTHFYAEGDMKNQPIERALQQKEKDKLASIGDQLDEAWIGAIDSSAFIPDRIMYRMTDSLGYDSVFVYAPQIDSNLFLLSFSFVGSGNGDYILDQTAVNGKVYRWVEPQNGQKQGDYAPIRLLVAPANHKMISFRTRYQFNKYNSLVSEVALSSQDLNRFSNKDDQDNQGVALNIALKNMKPIMGSKKWLLKSKLQYEFIQNTFTPIERIYEVEYDRNWNSLNLTSLSNQHKGQFTTQIIRKDKGSLSYNFENLYLNKNEQGLRHSSVLQWNNKQKWSVRGVGNLTQTQNLNFNTSFLKHNFNIEKAWNFIKIGVHENSEKNLFVQKSSDSLLKESFKFAELGAYFSNGDSLKHFFRIDYLHREDYRADSLNLNLSSFSNEWKALFRLTNDNGQQLNFIGAYRLLNIQDSNLALEKPEENLHGRIEHKLQLFHNALRSSTLYELNSGLELKKDYSFLEVAPGEGVFKWIDYNENGIKELDEFEIAAFKDEANYIKIVLPSQDYIKTLGNQFNSFISFSPYRLWHKSNRALLRFISRFNENFTYRSAVKTQDQRILNAANPFQFSRADSVLVFINNHLRNRMYYQGPQKKLKLEWNYVKNKNKTLMFNGFESRAKDYNEIRIQTIWGKRSSMDMSYESGNTQSESEYFTQRNFNINYYSIQPNYRFQADKNFRIVIGFIYKTKIDQISSLEAQNKGIKLHLKLTKTSRQNLQFEFNYFDWTYTGLDNDALAFEMLEGYRSGNNFRWIVQFQKKLMENLQLNISYEGRKSELVKTIHTGNVQLKAYF